MLLKGYIIWKVYQIENTHLVEYLLIAAFVSFQQGIDKLGFTKNQTENRKKRKHCPNNGNLREKWAKRTQQFSIS